MSRTRHREKEAKKRGAKAFSSHCANHGTCGWCQGNRHHKFERAAKEFSDEEVFHEEDSFAYLNDIDFEPDWTDLKNWSTEDGTLTEKEEEYIYAYYDMKIDMEFYK